MRRPFAALVLLALLAALVPAFVGSAVSQEAKDVKDMTTEELVAELKTQKELADRALFTQLVKSREPAAALALIEVYDVMGSPAGRLRVIESLPPFTDIADVNAKVLDKLTDIATKDKRRLLRIEAVAALAKSEQGGRKRLEAIVDSPAEDQIRIEAMRLHVEKASAADTTWYRKLWKPDEEEDGKKKKAKKDEEKKEPRRLIDLRRLAFQGLIKHLSTDELVEALSEEGGPNLRLAFEELTTRKAQEAEDRADQIFSMLEADPLARLAAAELLLALREDDFLRDVEKVGSNRQSSPALRRGLAEMLRDNADEKTLAKAAKNITKGKAEEKIFYALACARVEDDKVSKSYRKLLGDKELEVRTTAMRICAERGDDEAVEDLLEIVEDAEDADDPNELGIALSAISTIRDGNVEWGKQVRQYTTSPAGPLRIAALHEIAKRKDAEALPMIEKALGHEDWATRLAAIEACVEMRNEATIPMLIERLPKEEGRIETAVAEALFALTGAPYQKRAKAWESWWREEGAGFKCITPAELRSLERERAAQRLELTTSTSEFFGIEIESHRIAFVVDVSGSMEEKVKGQYVGEEGEMRIEVAKTELINFLDAMDAGALFNIIPFSDRARPIREEMVVNEPEALEEMKEEVRDLVASGGTNIYDGLRTAFADPEIDTIVVLSDGEPTEGEVLEINAIRQLAKRWNEHRGVVIHTVQIGATFELLRWLAEDSGGETVLIP
ncbi:von Willebrand factor type A domain protein [Planctomycetes bacterium Pla163]|uniref:von Willebrand factor type A domain protein n=1 Tax=Rohdeia mirabilis TaxID=2528008 RepID=A0A518D4C0_9BACT|nr:von Willebrand factor type A domain protein [Planctomycetes bacterium Pla163]